MLRLLTLEVRSLLRERLSLVLLVIMLAASALAFASGRALITQQIDGRAASAAEDAEASQSFAERLTGNLPPEEAILSPYRLRMGVMAPLPPLVDFSAGRAAFENYSTQVTMRSR
jgi:ABC-2 type transport system permease protein